MTKVYRLLGANGISVESLVPGSLGGNSNLRIYGRLECPSAVRHLPRGYSKVRVFFADEATAIAAGYRPCGKCLKDRYEVWKEGGEPGTSDYPWTITPRRPQLSKADVDVYVASMHTAFVLIRSACQGNDVERAEAIADAFHNLPHLLRPEHPWHEAYNPEDFWALFIKPLIARYPDLQERFGGLNRS